ncbi:SH3 domain-containing protein [Streptomyces silaceus]|uniref:SH3 domain-containing protein n=1 Tax=Streptomyces silaceus TaxID=545123 RepID=UPI000B00CDFE|nr:SH3 domain-containing protein [Streptomyces silaceus]
MSSLRGSGTRTRRAAVCLAAVAMLGLSVTAGTAHAQDTPAAPSNVTVSAGVSGVFTASGVNIRTGPSTSYRSLGHGQKGQAITVHCTANPWWYITNRVTGVTGWVYWPGNVLIDFGVGDPPDC